MYGVADALLKLTCWQNMTHSFPWMSSLKMSRMDTANRDGQTLFDCARAWESAGSERGLRLRTQLVALRGGLADVLCHRVAHLRRKCGGQCRQLRATLWKRIRMDRRGADAHSPCGCACSAAFQSP